MTLELHEEAARLASKTHRAANAATDLLEIVANILELAPKRGELTTLIEELAEAVVQAEHAWRDANHDMLTVAMRGWYAAHQDYTPIPLPSVDGNDGGPGDTMDHPVAVVAAAHRPTSVRT